MKRLVLLLSVVHLLPFGLAQTDRPPPRADAAFVGVNIVDVAAGRVIPNQTVVVKAGRITALSSIDDVEPPGDVVKADGRGRYLIPGLWDMHTHWYERETIPLFIANGVTGIRMMVGVPMHHEWRKAISAGEMIGPRLRIASGVFDGPQPIWPGSITVKNAEQAREAVGRAREGGADFIKVYELLPREAYFAIAEECEKLGLPFVGHVPLSILAQEAAEAGQKSIEHLEGLRLACSKDREELLKERIEAIRAAREAGEARPWMKGEDRIAARVEETYDEKVAENLFAFFKKKAAWQCPTLVVARSIGHLKDPAFTHDPRLEYILPNTRRTWNPENDFRFREMTEEDMTARREGFAKKLKLVDQINKAGVPILAGTDTGNPFCFPGFSLHDELELLVEAGLTPAEALRTATVNPARFLDKEETMGTIAKGKEADLVLLEENPLRDIANTRKIAGVMAAGRWFDRAKLDEILAQIKSKAGRESIGYTLFQKIKESRSVDAAIAEYRELRRRQPDRYNFEASELNMLGYRLLQFGRLDYAVKIFELNVEMFPKDWNVYDSLGEAYLKLGKKELAEKNYRRSLELNPRNENAADIIRKLTTEATQTP